MASQFAARLRFSVLFCLQKRHFRSRDSVFVEQRTKADGQRQFLISPPHLPTIQCLHSRSSSSDRSAASSFLSLSLCLFTRLLSPVFSHLSSPVSLRPKMASDGAEIDLYAEDIEFNQVIHRLPRPVDCPESDQNDWLAYLHACAPPSPYRIPNSMIKMSICTTMWSPHPRTRPQMPAQAETSAAAMETCREDRADQASVRATRVPTRTTKCPTRPIPATEICICIRRLIRWMSEIRLLFQRWEAAAALVAARRSAFTWAILLGYAKINSLFLSSHLIDLHIDWDRFSYLEQSFDLSSFLNQIFRTFRLLNRTADTYV